MIQMPSSVFGSNGGMVRRTLTGVALACAAVWVLACAGRADVRAAAEDGAIIDPQAALFAEIDTTLGLAIAQGQLAALQANDVGLRAFAVQSVARYTELRGRVRQIASRAGLPPVPATLDDSLAARATALVALRSKKGLRFDRAYVEEALTVHQALLQDLDAAARAVKDRELREALQKAGMA